MYLFLVLLFSNPMFGKGGGEGRENLRGKENEGEGRGGKINFTSSCLDSKKVGERKVKK